MEKSKLKQKIKAHWKLSNLRDSKTNEFSQIAKKE